VPTCKAKNRFALWVEDWAVLSLSDWNSSGWISLYVIHFDGTRERVGKKAFNVGWNGERFANTPEAKRMVEKYGQEEVDILIWGLMANKVHK